MKSKLPVKQEVIYRTKVRFKGTTLTHVWLLKSTWGNAFSIGYYYKRPAERQLRKHMRYTKYVFTRAILNSPDPKATAARVRLWG